MKKKALILILLYSLTLNCFSQNRDQYYHIYKFSKSQIGNASQKIKLGGHTKEVYTYIKDLTIHVKFPKLEPYQIHDKPPMGLRTVIELQISLENFVEHQGQRKSFAEISKLNTADQKKIIFKPFWGMELTFRGNDGTNKTLKIINHNVLTFSIDNPTRILKCVAETAGDYEGLFNAGSWSDAVRKYQGGWSCSVKMGNLFTTSATYNNWELPAEKTTGTLSFDVADNDDFWSNPTKAIAKNKKTNTQTSDDDFWSNPTKVIAENKTSSDDDFWNNPTKAINENKSSNGDDFWNSSSEDMLNYTYERFKDDGKYGLKFNGNIVILPNNTDVRANKKEDGFLNVVVTVDEIWTSDNNGGYNIKKLFYSCTFNPLGQCVNKSEIKTQSSYWEPLDFHLSTD